MDSDHCLGIFYLLENIKVSQVIIGKQFEKSENYNKFLQIVKQKNIKVKTVVADSKINIEKGLYFDVIWPMENSNITENIINNNSLLMKLNYKKFSMLFTGDIEKVAEEKIILEVNENILKSTVIKVAHHGSKTSSTENFINKVKPKYALIGVGENNKFGHPSNKTIDFLKKINCKIFRTDENGEISIVVDKNCNIKVKTFIK